MKNFWTDKEMEDELRLKIRDELRASMEKEFLMQLEMAMDFMEKEVEGVRQKCEELEIENRVLRMANLVGIKIADKFAKE